MTPAQKNKALSLLMRTLKIKEQFDEGECVGVEEDDKLTLDIRCFLIQQKAIPDRRKKKK